MKDAAAARVIKRYGNRKLYDPQAKAYVTLEDLARLIAEGHDVKVLDQQTDEDITTTVLAQVILEGLKERTARIPHQVLVRLIRLGMSPGAEIAKSAPPPDTVGRARQEAERIVARLLKTGRLPLEEALSLRQEIAGTLHKAVSETQRGLEQRFHNLMEWTERESGAVSPAIQALKEKLLTLESYLGGGRGKPAASRPRPERRSPARRRKRSRTTHS
jgi:polyhydroxyalkanoate synthesis repressor PhaR